MKLKVNSRSGRFLTEVEVTERTTVQELKKQYAKKCMDLNLERKYIYLFV